MTTTPDVLVLAGPAKAINATMTLIYSSRTKHAEIVEVKPVFRTTMFGNRRQCGLSLTIEVTGDRRARDLWVRALRASMGV